jgi:putative ABC transport system permease protein
MRLFDTDSFQEIWATITRNKFRSIATGFGVFWGLFMLIVLLALGNKIKYSIMSQVEGMEVNSVFFFPDRTSEAYKGYRKGRWWSFDNSDVALVRQRAQSVDLISPILFGGGGDKNVVRGIKSGSYRFQGVYPAQFGIEPMNVLQGRLINEVDITERRKVCVIGEEIYKTLYDVGENPVGTFIRVSGIYFQVIGVITPKTGVSIMGRADENIYLPYTTFQMVFDRSKNFWFLACTAKSGYTAEQVDQEVRTIISAAHSISPTDTKAIESVNLELQFRMMSGLFTGITALMWIVGLGALFSGIIGISNIMLVTVRERMREIGVRRALGAKPLDIMLQIMSESFVLTAIAGLLGFMCGIGISIIIDKAMVLDPDMVMTQPIISFNLAMAAMAVLVVSGVIAGLLPAWRALKIKAIDAIRDE